MVKNGDTIKKSSEIIGVSRKTGERWVKEYNEKGVDGLMPDYSKCGLESKLDDKKLNVLYDIIVNSEKGFTIKDVQYLIRDLFHIDFSYSNVWFITRKKIGIKLW